MLDQERVLLVGLQIGSQRNIPSECQLRRRDQHSCQKAYEEQTCFYLRFLDNPLLFLLVFRISLIRRMVLRGMLEIRTVLEQVCFIVRKMPSHSWSLP